MPWISKNLLTGESLFFFSTELVWACRFHAKNAKETSSVIALRASNIAAIFAAGSYIEARLNEISAMTQNIGSEERTKDFWKHLHKTRKDRSFIDKWNLISSLHSGIQWEPSREPFQSYDLITSLRNELIHYKGEFGDGNNPPTNKLKGLAKKLHLNQTQDEKTSTTGFWVDSFLSSKKLAPWIETVVTEFDMKIEHMLSGKEFTDQEKTFYQLRQISYEHAHSQTP